MIVDYNKHMLGVELVQMLSYYCFLHKTIKWWRKVVFWILEVATVNAYILHKMQAEKQEERPNTHLNFRRQLILSLSEPIRSSVNSRARPGSQVSDIQRLRPVPHFLQKGTKRRDCVMCSDREEGGTRHLSLFMCGTCTDKPSLCPAGCFQAYHTRHYRHSH